MPRYLEFTANKKPLVTKGIATRSNTLHCYIINPGFLNGHHSRINPHPSDGDGRGVSHPCRWESPLVPVRWVAPRSETSARVFFLCLIIPPDKPDDPTPRPRGQ